MQQRGADVDQRDGGVGAPTPGAACADQQRHVEELGVEVLAPQMACAAGLPQAHTSISGDHHDRAGRQGVQKSTDRRVHPVQGRVVGVECVAARRAPHAVEVLGGGVEWSARIREVHVQQPAPLRSGRQEGQRLVDDDVGVHPHGNVGHPSEDRRPQPDRQRTAEGGVDPPLKSTVQAIGLQARVPHRCDRGIAGLTQLRWP